jgi:hypothetical protein
LPAGHLLTIPIDREVPQLVALPHSACDASDGPFERQTVLALAAGQQFRIDIARVDEVLHR